jgi:hypothetical protein
MGTSVVPDGVEEWSILSRFDCTIEIAIALIDPDFGEQTAQTSENAWLQQLDSATTA